MELSTRMWSVEGIGPGSKKGETIMTHVTSPVQLPHHDHQTSAENPGLTSSLALTTGQDLLDQLFLGQPEVLHVQQLSDRRGRGLGGILGDDHDGGRGGGFGLFGLEQELRRGHPTISSRVRGLGRSVSSGKPTVLLREKLLPFHSSFPLRTTSHSAAPGQCSCSTTAS